MRSQRDRLLDMLEAMEEIEEYSSLGHDAYVQNKLIQGWMILQLERIGEAAASLSESIRSECPHIPWQDIVGMRNLLIHEYFGISPTRVWMTVVNDIPVLKDCVNRILETMNAP
ncbi:MAG: DUF86 domain-containing protein [Pseudomonadota bacterium]